MTNRRSERSHLLKSNVELETQSTVQSEVSAAERASKIRERVVVPLDGVGLGSSDDAGLVELREQVPAGLTSDD